MAERIVSLAPSVTNIVTELDATDRLVGTAGDGTVGQWVTPDLEAIARLDPDLVLTTDDLQKPIVHRLRERDIPTAHYMPSTLPDVYQYIRDLGPHIGKPDEARELANNTESRIAAVRSNVSGNARPVVYCEEWSDPPMVAGNWVPDVVAAAGGSYPFCAPGERSHRIEEQEIARAEPAHAIVHICGRGTDVDPCLLDQREWDIPAVHVIDDDLLNQPGPRLADAVERIAHLLHPDDQSGPA